MTHNYDKMILASKFWETVDHKITKDMAYRYLSTSITKGEMTP
jgi:hypothetical protein